MFCKHCLGKKKCEKYQDVMANFFESRVGGSPSCLDIFAGFPKIKGRNNSMYANLKYSSFKPPTP